MKRVQTIAGAGVLLVASLFAGCVNLERSYPERRYFVIQVDEPKNTAAANEQVLSVANFRISPRFADRSFVYRTSETEFETDFYNQFLSDPAVLITEEARKALGAAPFKFVVGPASPLAPNFVLEGSINALYGDFRNAGAPAAVMEIEFFLHREDPGRPGVVLRKAYRKAVPLNERSPQALAQAWSAALEAIVAEFVADLNAQKL